MVTETHPVVLRGPRGLGGEAPFIAQRSDDAFLPAMLATLADADTWTTLAADATPVTRGRMSLFQPVQRTFHVAIVEALCATLGAPRLDPAKIESAGFVVRRLRADGREEGWGRVDEKLVGWRLLDEPDADPDPARRPAPRTGVPAIDARLAAARRRRPALAETVERLYLAPPAAAAATGRTLLYAIVPTASTEMTEPGAIELTDAEVRDAVPPQLRALAAGSVQVPAIGHFANAGRAADPALAENKPWQDYLGLLHQLVVQLDAFAGPAAAQFRAALAPITISLHGDRTANLYDHLRDAARVLVEGGAGQVRLPSSWPQISGAAHQAVQAAVRTGLTARLGEVAPRTPRYARQDAVYRLRAFIRVRGHDGCPTTLVWSPPSGDFTLARWFDQGPVKPAPIELPEVSSVKRLAPNVSFAVPPGLFRTLQALKLDKLLDGKGEEKGAGEPGWICGFNIPIITIVAFILLYLMLALLHIIFWWLPFVRVCLPVPRSLSNRS